MADLFNKDFQDFIQFRYAVILHGYIRSTADIDIWVNKTAENYQKLRKTIEEFGAPSFSQNEFLGNKFNVWGIGKEPNRIEIMSEVKGVSFDTVYKESSIYKQGNLIIRYISFSHLLTAKKAAGRFKDKNDIEQLNKKKKK